MKLIGRNKKLMKQGRDIVSTMSLSSIVASYQEGRVWLVVLPMIPLPLTYTFQKLWQDEFVLQIVNLNNVEWSITNIAQIISKGLTDEK